MRHPDHSLLQTFLLGLYLLTYTSLWFFFWGGGGVLYLLAFHLQIFVHFAKQTRIWTLNELIATVACGFK
jgi:hypothetical protein